MPRFFEASSECIENLPIEGYFARVSEENIDMHIVYVSSIPKNIDNVKIIVSRGFPAGEMRHGCWEYGLGRWILRASP